MDQYTIEKKLIEAVTNIEKYGVEYADAKGRSYNMQKLREVVLATEMGKVLGTNAHKNMEALQKPEYILHLEGTAEAIAKEQKSKAIYTRWTSQVDVLKAFLYLEKQKAKIL